MPFNQWDKLVTKWKISWMYRRDCHNTNLPWKNEFIQKHRLFWSKIFPRMLERQLHYSEYILLQQTWVHFLEPMLVRLHLTKAVGLYKHNKERCTSIHVSFKNLYIFIIWVLIYIQVKFGCPGRLVWFGSLTAKALWGSDSKRHGSFPHLLFTTWRMKKRK